MPRRFRRAAELTGRLELADADVHVSRHTHVRDKGQPDTHSVELVIRGSDLLELRVAVDPDPLLADLADARDWLRGAFPRKVD